MKFHLTSLLAVAFAVISVGCGPQSSTPLAASPTVRPAATPAPIQADKPTTEPKKAPSSGERYSAVPVGATETLSADAPSNPSAGEKPGKSADAASTRPKADREPTRPGDPEKISFDDLNLGMQADMVYRPFMLTDRAKELEGKQIRLSGEMYGGVLGREKLKEFVILRNRECKYGPGGQADHVAQVKMKDGQTAKFTAGTIRVEGTLRIRPVNDDKDGNTKHVFVLEDAVLK